MEVTRIGIKWDLFCFVLFFEKSHVWEAKVETSILGHFLCLPPPPSQYLSLVKPLEGLCYFLEQRERESSRIWTWSLFGMTGFGRGVIIAREQRGLCVCVPK